MVKEKPAVSPRPQAPPVTAAVVDVLPSSGDGKREKVCTL